MLSDKYMILFVDICRYFWPIYMSIFMKILPKSIDQIIHVPLRRLVSNFMRYIAHVVLS